MIIVLSILFISVLAVFYSYFLGRRNYWKKKNVPHIKPTPVFGNFGEYILMKKYIGHVTQDICRAFPNEPYIGTYYGSEPALLVKDLELLKLVMTKDFYYFSSREISKYVHNEVITQNIFFGYGDKWKILRQNLTPVFSSAKMKKMFHLIERCSYVFEKLLDKEESKPQEVRTFTARFTMDCIGNCAFGIDTKTMENEPSSNPFYQIGKKILRVSNTIALKAMARAMWPALFYGLGFKTFPTEGDKFFKNILVNVIKEREMNPSTRNDFIDFVLNFKKQKYVVGDAMMNTKTGEDKKIRLEVDDDMLVAQCLVFFLAGYETSSTILAYTLYELAKNKDIQRRVQEEIDSYLDRYNNHINYEVVKELVYSDACLSEAGRLYPVLAVLTREVVEDYTFPTGLTVEKGMRVHIPVYYLHHNPDYFPDPETFRPERFLPGEEENIKPYTYMPFGEGPRICIGARFAKMQMLAGLVTILKKFDVELAEGMPRSVEFDSRSIVTQSKTGINLKFVPRPKSQQRVFAPLK